MIYVDCRTSPPWWWTVRSQSCWFRCSRRGWSCGRNPVLFSHCPIIEMKKFGKEFKTFGSVLVFCSHCPIIVWNSLRGNVKPLCQCWSAICWAEKCASGGAKLPPMSLNTFSTRHPPIFLIQFFFQAPFHEPEHILNLIIPLNILPCFYLFFPSPLPWAWTHL